MEKVCKYLIAILLIVLESCISSPRNVNIETIDSLQMVLNEGNIDSASISEKSFCEIIRDNLAKYLLNDTIFPDIRGCSKIGDYHLLFFTEGEDCERKYCYRTINNRFEVVDSLNLYGGGCPFVTTPDEVFGVGGEYDYFRKDTIGNYCYANTSEDFQTLMVNDSILYISSTEYMVKDIISEKYYTTEFIKKEIFSIDSKGYFYLKREVPDSFSDDSLFARIK